MNYSPSNFSHHFIREPAKGIWREELLIQWWYHLKPGCLLETTSGEIYHLLDPGQRNRHDGPDVCGAKLFSTQGLLRGDVEFHRQEREWAYHGHHLDSHYNKVILHVALKKSTTPAINCEGRVVPLLLVPSEVLVRTPLPSCRLAGTLGTEELITKLAPLALLRWQGKVNALRTAVRRYKGVQQAFYEASFWALGLKGNEKNFLRLSQRLPLRKLTDLKVEKEIWNYLLQSSGLRTPHSWNGMTFTWRRGGIRPAAQPETRMRFGATLAAELLNGWSPWLQPKALTITDLHQTFGSKLPGQSWCCEWLGNVVYPLQTIWQEKSSRCGNDFLEQWWKLKNGQSYGILNRKFSKYLDPQSLKCFGIQQGLLALQSRYCREGLCVLCPLRES